MYARTIAPMTPATLLRKVMMWPVATVEGGTSLAEVAEALAAEEVGALCVTEDGRLVGIVSERDVVAHVAAGADLAHLTAAEVMSNDLVMAAPDDSVLEAARMMEGAQVRHLPVLDDGRIAGIVSMRDLFAVLLDQIHEPVVVVVRDGGGVTVVDG
jgi:CBS domain-containing protein